MADQHIPLVDVEEDQRPSLCDRVMGFTLLLMLIAFLCLLIPATIYRGIYWMDQKNEILVEQWELVCIGYAYMFVAIYATIYAKKLIWLAISYYGRAFS